MLAMTFAPALAAAEREAYIFPEGSASVNVTLDGKRILEGKAAIINSVTYVPLREFSELVGAESVKWNAQTRTATVKRGTVTLYVTDGGYYISALDRYFYTGEKVLNINGRLFVPIRSLSNVFSLNVGWNAQTRTAVLTSTGKALKSASSYYNSDDLYWLSRIIYAEAGGESLEGQIAVGNVVLNRKAHSSYPNTVYGVIFDRKGGTQFTPVAIGTIYKTPSNAAVIAAKICLEGTTMSTEALFFMNPRIATSNWISRNCKFLFTIGNHDFYGLWK
jgi:N-acetylmuramoyl-L-alanine amidase